MINIILNQLQLFSTMLVNLYRARYLNMTNQVHLISRGLLILNSKYECDTNLVRYLGSYIHTRTGIIETLYEV